MPQSFVPAAQYLRMSTDHQQYSLDNQADTIARYAADHGFVIVKTYSDAAKSGLRLKNRPGLKQLLKDAVGGQLEFRVVLVYDVSRWGRFQDADEAAHYEYLCKSSGVPVHYCAETFSNDNTMPGLIMKALKRTMASEYSRELSVKVRAGLFRLAKLGYRLGGNPPYGMRRLLRDACGRPKQLLAAGERKSLASEHVILVPGPPQEIAVVKRIFHEFADEKRSLNSIARQLDRDGIPFPQGIKWDRNAITHILRQPSYVGIQVWGRTATSLTGPVKRVAPEQWTICPNAFEPTIEPELFERAQAVFANLTCHLSNEQLLEPLKKVLGVHGRLTTGIIRQSRLCPAATTYYRRFGGLLRAYALLGYHKSEKTSALANRQRTMLIRSELVRAFLDQFPKQLQENNRGWRLRSRLRDRRSGLLIVILVTRCCPAKNGDLRWFLDCVQVPRAERDRITVLALLDEKNATIKELRVFRRMNFPGESIRLREGNKWLQSGTRLEQIAEFFDVLKRVRESS
jgi:DNA invertase Pin-like site-specific DNA recombinase